MCFRCSRPQSETSPIGTSDAESDDLMAPVLIQCPDTGEFVPTGLNVNALNELEPANVLDPFPACDYWHSLGPDDALLSDAVPVSEVGSGS